MAAVYAYLRVSTDAQDVANQKRGVVEYCAAKQWVPAFVEDTISGRTPWRERTLGQLLDRMQSGDVLVVSEVSRLARSTLQVLEIMQHTTTRDIRLHVVKSGLVLDGSMQAKVVATMFGLAAEIERDFIAARTREALQRCKEQGMKLGRPPGPAKELMLDRRADEIDRLMKAKVPKRAIARVLDCSPQTLHAWLKARRGPEAADEPDQAEPPPDTTPTKPQRRRAHHTR